MTSRPGQFALGARVRLQRHRRKARDLAQRRTELADDLVVAERLVVGGERVNPREFLPGDRVHLARGIELHRARAQRDHRGVESDVLALERLHVAHHRRLGVMRVEDRVRQVGRRPTQRRRNDVARAVDERPDLFRRLLLAPLPQTPPLSAAHPPASRSHRARCRPDPSSGYRKLKPASVAATLQPGQASRC